MIIAWIILLAAGIFAAFYFYKKLEQSKERAHQVEAELRQMEMKLHTLELEAIKYKINPHLFKNTLNSILSHAYQTYHSLDRLANVLDYILYESDHRYVALKDEMAFIVDFIEINKLKLSPLFNLQVKNGFSQQSPEIMQSLIAPLITVDLIENAFKHADIQTPDAFISIVFEWKDNAFHLVVSNKISPHEPIKKPNSGFGKENFKKRLEIIYGGFYELNTSTKDDVYTAHLKINLPEHKNKMLTVG